MRDVIELAVFLLAPTIIVGLMVEPTLRGWHGYEAFLAAFSGAVLVLTGAVAIGFICEGYKLIRRGLRGLRD